MMSSERWLRSSQSAWEEEELCERRGKGSKVDTRNPLLPLKVRLRGPAKVRLKLESVSACLPWSVIRVS